MQCCEPFRPLDGVSVSFKGIVQVTGGISLDSLRRKPLECGRVVVIRGRWWRWPIVRWRCSRWRWACGKRFLAGGRRRARSVQCSETSHEIFRTISHGDTLPSLILTCNVVYKGMRCAKRSRHCDRE